MSENHKQIAQPIQQGTVDQITGLTYGSTALNNLACIKGFASLDNGVQYAPVSAVYIGESAMTPSDYAALPIYSEILDVAGSKKYYKTAAAGTSTWKYSSLS